MYNPLWDWLKGALQFILDALQAVVDAINPFLYILRVLDVFVAILPEPADFSEFYDTYLLLMAWLAPSFQLINHFVNLPVFGVAVFSLLIIEGSLNLFRAWRIIRSTVT